MTNRPRAVPCASAAPEKPDLHIAGEYGDGRSALAAILANPPDLLFLDIQIDTVNGIALARSLDQQNLPDIVFVTAYDRYALEAFEVCASDYLLKPFDYERFKAPWPACGADAAAQKRMSGARRCCQWFQGWSATSRPWPTPVRASSRSRAAACTSSTSPTSSWSKGTATT